jgi:predicted PurR-regulated permease PerM
MLIPATSRRSSARAMLYAEPMPERGRRVAVVIPWRTILKLIATAILVWLWFKLVEVVLVLIVALLLAVTLNPVVGWLERRRLPRWAATLAVGLMLVAVIGGFLWMTWASLSSQAEYVTTHFDQFQRDAMTKVPGWMRNAVGGGTIEDVEARVAGYALSFAQSAASAVVVSLLGFILMLYFLIEGAETRDWLMAFVPAGQRPRVRQTLVECERVIFAYVAGNVMTSIFATIVVGVSMALLKVPAALLLAVIAGICDFVPVIGFIASSVPAILLGFTVSTNTGLIVAAIFVAYHAIENYLIGPWAYGDRLKLSNIAVVLAFVVGAEVAGVIGALIALPVAAVYPAIERIWLREKLPEETVIEHKQIEHRKAG